MVEIIDVRRVHVPALRLIGKRYTDNDRNSDGTFRRQWDEWLRNGWFAPLEAFDGLPEHEGSRFGCVSVAGGFSYWIGMFFPRGTPVPEGYVHADIPEGDVGMCEIRGRADDEEISGPRVHELCVAALRAAGLELMDRFETSPWPWSFERHQRTRSTVPDSDGEVILDYGIYLQPEPRAGARTLPPESEACLEALHRVALAHGCTFRIDESAAGRTIVYSARALTVKAVGDAVAFSGDYDLRSFMRLYRETDDDRVRKMLFEAAIPCCYCIDDKCTTFLMAKERTIHFADKAKKLCGPYRHSLVIDVTKESLSACIDVLEMMFQYVHPHQHRDPVVLPKDVVYEVAEEDGFYLVGSVQRHSPVSPSDEEFVRSMLHRDAAGKRRIDAIAEAAGVAASGRLVGAIDNFVNGASYDFIFGVATDRRPAAIPEGAVCRPVHGGQWAVYHSRSGDYPGIWRHFTQEFYKLERKGFDAARIPFERYDETGRFSDVHIPVDADLPESSGRVLQVLHTPNELLAGFRDYAETDYPLNCDRPFDVIERIAEAFPHAQCLYMVSIHSLYGKPLMGFAGVPIDDLSVVPDDFERYEMKGGYWRRLSYKHFNGGYQGWGEAIQGRVESAVPLFTMNHPRGFNEYRYAARGGYSEIGVPMRLLGKRSFTIVELPPQRLIGKREAPPESVVTEEDIRRFYDMAENTEKGSYVIAYTWIVMKTTESGGWSSYFDKPFVQGVLADADAAVPEGLSAFTLDGGVFAKVVEDLPNGVLGWEMRDILQEMEATTGRVRDPARQFIYHQYDRGTRYELYVPVSPA